MTTHPLTIWKTRETKLADRRKFLCDRGSTLDAALADTAVEQARNNRSYDRIMRKYGFRRLVSSIV